MRHQVYCRNETGSFIVITSKYPCYEGYMRVGMGLGIEYSLPCPHANPYHRYTFTDTRKGDDEWFRENFTFIGYL